MGWATSYWISLKKTAGWDALTAFLENITSWVCLEISGLKSLFISNSDKLTSFTTEKREVSSAKRFVVEERLLFFAEEAELSLL